MQRQPMTQEGAKTLQDELQKLKKVDRPAVSKAIAEAREHGDLKENAEYHAAREEQGLIEGRITYLEGLLGSIQVIDVTKLSPNGKIVFGATVTVMNLDTEEEVTYKIVGHEEADIKQDKISVNSPIARALIGKEEGDEATVEAPSGKINYEVVEVQYI